MNRRGVSMPSGEGAKSLRAWLCVALVAAIWASSFVLVKMVLAHTGPFTVGGTAAFLTLGGKATADGIGLGFLSLSLLLFGKGRGT